MLPVEDFFYLSFFTQPYKNFYRVMRWTDKINGQFEFTGWTCNARKDFLSLVKKIEI